MAREGPASKRSFPPSRRVLSRIRGSLQSRATPAGMSLSAQASLAGLVGIRPPENPIRP